MLAKKQYKHLKIWGTRGILHYKLLSPQHNWLEPNTLSRKPSNFTTPSNNRWWEIPYLNIQISWSFRDCQQHCLWLLLNGPTTSFELPGNNLFYVRETLNVKMKFIMSNYFVASLKVYSKELCQKSHFWLWQETLLETVSSSGTLSKHFQKLLSDLGSQKQLLGNSAKQALSLIH